MFADTGIDQRCWGCYVTGSGLFPFSIVVSIISIVRVGNESGFHPSFGIQP